MSQSPSQGFLEEFEQAKRKRFVLQDRLEPEQHMLQMPPPESVFGVLGRILKIERMAGDGTIGAGAMRNASSLSAWDCVCCLDGSRRYRLHNT